MERRSISIRGLVQGVGFRPYVHGLASRLSLSGFVTNETGGVRIEVEGESGSLDRFLEELPRSAPPSAHIERVSWKKGPPRGDGGFRIQSSPARPGVPSFLADQAVCGDCARELFDPDDRRFHYPFLNCTRCGPRLTIVTGAPYDRERTTMAAFTMCSRCRNEYEDPGDRRFHAQPTACPECGPRLRWVTQEGRPGKEPLAGFVATVLDGGIGALKGLGGFHLVCDATSAEAVARLRERKNRYEKPFAVMVKDLEQARAIAYVDEDEEGLLSSPRGPIVLLRKRRPFALAFDVAPNNPDVGLMLPYTPLHLLLMDAVGERPLVMTSGNRSDEPIAYRDEEAGERLRGIADVILGNDRPVRVRCDDSVTRFVAGQELLLRRSRGYAPEPIPLPRPASKRLLAVGGHLKCTFALGIEDRAFLSHHIGDLDDARAYEALERDIRLYETLFGFSPDALVHDLHPDYLSTRYAVERGTREGLPTIAVQHHHAHVASAMAEHGIAGPILGVVFDGTGFGEDGTIWGGEFLVGDASRVERRAHLRKVPLPGGDAAARQPWRMALSHLLDAAIELPWWTDRLEKKQIAWKGVATMIERRVNAPLTSSVGRLFDAVAALLDIRWCASYEGQPAMELEWLCEGQVSKQRYPFELESSIIDTRPIIRGVVADLRSGVERAEIARRFHATVIAFVVATSEEIRETSGLERIVLSGGVFQNVLLSNGVSEQLTQKGFAVHRHRKVPPNDGGLSLGQLAVAASRLGA